LQNQILQHLNDKKQLEQEKLHWKEKYYEVTATNKSKDDTLSLFVRKHILYITLQLEFKSLQDAYTKLEQRRQREYQEYENKLTNKARRSYAKKMRKETGDDIGDI